jgi:integrase
MDMTVTGIGLVVVEELRAAGSMESTIGQYEKTIKALKVFRRGTRRHLHVLTRRGVRVDDGQSAYWQIQCAALVRLRPFEPKDSYVRTGRVDLSCRTRGGGGARSDSSEFTALAAAWEADMDDRGLAPATRDAYGRVSRGYLVFLESRGIRCLDDADGASVLGFLESPSGRWARSSLFWVVSNFRLFLKFTGRIDLVDAAGLAGAQRFHAILPVLSDDDERRVVRACASGAVSARDAAITLLALTTGLGACDIVHLRLADIDWRARTAEIVQQKTNNPLTVPLTDPLVGKLADDVLDERPDSPDDHVFLRCVAPPAWLADHAWIYWVIADVFGTAGLTDVTAGPRLLRHNAASRLLRAALPWARISAVLGHASPESTNLDRSADEDRLLECVLDVPEGSRS